MLAPMRPSPIIASCMRDPQYPAGEAAADRRTRAGASVGLSPRLVQEPDAPLGLVDPDLDQAGRRHVVVLLADGVRLAHARGELLVVVAPLRQHVGCGHVVAD